jgi:hypothetical protein
MTRTTLPALATAVATLACVGAGVAQAAAPTQGPITRHELALQRHAAARRWPAERGLDATARPREMLFETAAQDTALYQPYDDCLTLHATRSGPPWVPSYKLAGAGAQAACRSYDPLPPWQYDASNPQSMAFVDAVVACLHVNGAPDAQALTAPAGSDRNEIALGGPSNDISQITAGLDAMTQCEHVALGSTPQIPR